MCSPGPQWAAPGAAGPRSDPNDGPAPAGHGPHSLRPRPGACGSLAVTDVDHRGGSGPGSPTFNSWSQALRHSQGHTSSETGSVRWQRRGERYFRALSSAARAPRVTQKNEGEGDALTGTMAASGRRGQGARRSTRSTQDPTAPRPFSTLRKALSCSTSPSPKASTFRGRLGLQLAQLLHRPRGERGELLLSCRNHAVLLWKRFRRKRPTGDGGPGTDNAQALTRQALPSDLKTS